MMRLSRRDVIQLGTLGTLAAAGPTSWMSPAIASAAAAASGATRRPEADHTLRINTGLVELASDNIVSTTLYNGQFPGPLLRLREGVPVIIDIFNDTDTPELVHWHGQTVPSTIDGAAEEGTPYLPPHSMRRIRLVPGPAGFRFVHTHVTAGANLNRGTYTGQAAPVYIEPKNEPGNYDREIFLVMKEFQPAFSRGGDMDLDALAGRPLAPLTSLGKRNEDQYAGPKGYEVGYQSFSINGKSLGHGEPIRVQQGERVLLHVLNASATEIRSLALPGHRFRVVALDGNPVPHPAEVPVLWLGTAERVSAIVEMTHPGVWVLGDTIDDDRHHGMGIVVEYAGQSGQPQWRAPPPFHWDYAMFGHPDRQAPEPDETIEILAAKHNAAANGFNLWTLNGEAFSMARMAPTFNVRQGRRYRVKVRNASDDIHPLHLHRHSFELVRVGDRPTAGVMKDVVMLGGFQEVEFDFLANNPGPTLFHCHQQLHMDFGFMALFRYT
jgi:FtsP/CotA-like multicopper oxidase with cupredoxin domain